MHCVEKMPETDCHSLLRALREDRTATGAPFIFLTPNGENRD